MAVSRSGTLFLMDRRRSWASRFPAGPLREALEQPGEWTPINVAAMQQGRVPFRTHVMPRFSGAPRVTDKWLGILV